MCGSKTALIVLRSIAVAASVVVLVLGMWSLVIIQRIDSSQGQSVLAALAPRLEAEGPSWSQFITAAMRGTARTWLLVATSIITALTTLTVIISNRYYWLRISPSGVLFIESASTVSVIIAFACALSLAISVRAFDTRPLPSFSSSDLSFFALLDPLSRGLTITSSAAACLLLAALTVHGAAFQQQRKRANDTRSFEPTVSALGMSHGFHTLHTPLRAARPPIPTVYDPYRAFQKGPGAQRPGAMPEALTPLSGLQSGVLRSGAVPGEIGAKHVEFADEGMWMSRRSESRWSVSTASPKRVEGDIVRLVEVRKTIDLKKSRRAVEVKPTRPASRYYRESSVSAL